MKRVAIFVEGLTELLLIQKLVAELCGQRGVNMEIWRQANGSLAMVTKSMNPAADLFVLLADCATDSQVKSQIVAQYPTLVAAGYSRILGLRDVFPMTWTHLSKVQAHLNAGLPAGTVPISMHLAILETEAWFLDEHTHFARIHPSLSLAHITGSGFDIANIAGAQWAAPAETLDMIYRLAGMRYHKRGSHIQRTVAALSAEELYINVRARAPSFAQFIDDLEAALF